MANVKRYNPPKIGTVPKKKGLFLLYLFLIPLFLSVVLALFQLKFTAFFINGIAFLLFFATLVLSKMGFLQESIYDNKQLTRAPKTPYKQLAAYLMGISTFFAAYVAGGQPLFKSLFLGGIAVFGYWLYYGFDPRKDKLQDFGDISADLVLDTFHEAHGKIEAIEKDTEIISDRVLSDKIDQALEQARTILEAIAKDPKDIRTARKFLNVYIDGVAKVTRSYTALDEKEIDPETRERLLHLMDDVESRFEKELKRLKSNNEFDLDVHIDVLKEQIKH